MKRGFTLVELLVVIVILSLIAMVAYPSIITIINDSKNSAYDAQVEIIVKAGKEWGVEHPNELPSSSSVKKKICLTSLVSEGYIDDTIKNPKDSKPMTGYVEVSLSGNRYNYQYKEGTC